VRYFDFLSILTVIFFPVDWADNARDILNFLLYYLPSTISSAILPIHLSRVSDDTAERRKISGFVDNHRQIVGIGHSLGGCSMFAYYNFDSEV
jgi:hypothetical protein